MDSTNGTPRAPLSVTYGPCEITGKYTNCDTLLPTGTGLCLEIGARRSAYRNHVTAKGYKYVSVDLNPHSTLSAVADAHRLPFREKTFDALLLPCVLEHFHDPARALKEAARVLKPGGILCGQVAFLEPFHRSYFHHSHMAVEHLFREVGLTNLYLDTGVTGLVLVTSRMLTFAGLRRAGLAHWLARTLFPFEVLLPLYKSVALGKHWMKHRSWSNFPESFAERRRDLSLRMAGHLLFRANAPLRG